MKDKIVYHYLLPIMLHIPLLKKLAIKIWTKKLAGIVVESINNYKTATDLLNDEKMKDNPLWTTTLNMTAVMALIPAAIIFNQLKSNSQSRLRRINEL